MEFEVSFSPAHVCPTPRGFVLSATMHARSAHTRALRAHTHSLADFIKWAVPAAGAAAAPISVSAGTAGANCVITSKVVGAGLSCDPGGSGCITLGACASAPAFAVKGANIETKTGSCIDYETSRATAQLYKCVNSGNQGWHFDAESGKIVATFPGANGAFLGLSTDGNCKPWAGGGPAPG